ncbi:hypothetical protein [Teichococcus aestuarii]|uniref:hypothetical protein n=1 Tax=Teichococcus aestuarii TaxID=568898 RepID=UPI003615A83E
MESCAPCCARRTAAPCCSTSAAAAPRSPGSAPARGQAELIGYVSLPLGVVTLAERAGLCCYTPEGFGRVVDEVTEQLTEFDRVHSIGREMRAGGVRLMGTSGTVTTLAGVALSLPRYSRPLVDGRVLDIEVADQRYATCSISGGKGCGRIPASAPNGRISSCPAAPSMPPSAGCGPPPASPSPIAGCGRGCCCA